MWIARVSADGSIELWKNDPSTKVARAIDVNDGVSSFGFVGLEGTLAVGGKSGVLSLWKCSTGEREAELKCVGEKWQPVQSLASTPDGAIVAGGNTRVFVFERSSSKNICVLDSDLESARSMAISHDGRRLLVGHDEGRMTLWSLPQGKKLRSFSGHLSIVYAVAFHPSKPEIMASASLDGTVLVWKEPQ
jgi:WD40 repeat protein